MTPEDQARIDAIKEKHRKIHKKYESNSLWSKLKRLNNSNDGSSALPRLDHTQDIDKVVNELSLKNEYIFNQFNAPKHGNLILSIIAIVFYIGAGFMFNHLNQLGDNLKTLLGTLFFAGFGTLFFWFATRWCITTFNIQSQTVTRQRGLFFLKFHNFWRFCDFKEIHIKEKSHTDPQSTTRNTSSHYRISLVHRNGKHVCFEILHDGFEAMYTAKVISKVTGLRVTTNT